MRLGPAGGDMKALSIRQPWAWLIVHGGNYGR